MLVRHWNLYDSMFHTPYIATRLKVWKESGRRMQDTFLAKMGIPKDEAMKQWMFMSVETKRTLRRQLEQYAPKFNLPQAIFQSFFIQTETKYQISACDAVYSVAALLEHSDPSLHLSDTKGSSRSGASGRSSNAMDADEEKDRESHPVDEAPAWERNFWQAYDAISRCVSVCARVRSLCLVAHVC